MTDDLRERVIAMAEDWDCGRFDGSPQSFALAVAAMVAEYLAQECEDGAKVHRLYTDVAARYEAIGMDGCAVAIRQRAEGLK